MSINPLTRVGNMRVVYTPGIDMMGISRQGIVMREHVEEVVRRPDESITVWHARAIVRAKELAKGLASPI